MRPPSAEFMFRMALLGLVAAASGVRFTVRDESSVLARLHVLRDADYAASACGHPDEICGLPGFKGNLHLRMRSGYITVSEVSDRRLFYVVADHEGGGRHGADPEAPGDHDAVVEGVRTVGNAHKGGSKQSRDEGDAPVVLWLTGGPGCSSLDAFIYEHGPFSFGRRANGDISLEPNPYSWTKAATMIYVDSPAGAGMSYSGRPEVDYHTNDEYTIADLVTFLEGLTERYPELAERDFYITGESYGGVFVPLLARVLLRANRQRLQDGLGPLVQLRGYAVGNAVTDDTVDGNAQLQFAADMGFIDPPTWRQIRDACDDMFWNATPGSACWDAQRGAKDALYDVNWYDVLDGCTYDNYDSAGSSGSGNGEASGGSEVSGLAATASEARMHWPFTVRMAQAEAGEAEELGERRRRAQEAEGGKSAEEEERRRGGRRLWGGRLRHVAPCLDRKIALEYLNRDDVRAALHAAPRSTTGRWEPCSDVLYYALDTMALVPLHEELVRAGLRALVYSGDHDMVVPHTGTRAWLYGSAHLGGAEGPLRPWKLNGQVAGFTARFPAGAGLTFASVKGAGHMVPQSKPAAALHLLRAFLQDREL